MKNMHRFLSLVLVLLLVTACYVPAVSADSSFIEVVTPVPSVIVPPAPILYWLLPVAVPELAEIIISGVTVVMTGAAALKIAEHLGMKWDETLRGWDRMMTDTGRKLTDLFAAPNWVYATSPQAKAVLAFDYATAGSGGKKDDKLYHKAKRDKETGMVKINTERISQKDAAKELKEGRDIFTVTKSLAEKVVERAFGKENVGKLENHGLSKDGRCCKKGYYDHYHPENQHVRPHCWIWDNL